MKNQEQSMVHLEHLRRLLVETAQIHNYNFRHGEVLGLSMQIDLLINTYQLSGNYKKENNSLTG